MLMWHRRVADAQHACAYGHLLLLQGLAKALQRNTSLESFTFNANETSFGEKTGVAMADALERKHEPAQEERREERG